MSENGTNSMAIKRFARLLEIYGAEPGRWPEGERAAMLALLEREPEAQRIAAEARALERLLALDAVGQGAAAAGEPIDHDALIAGALDRVRRAEGETDPARADEPPIVAGANVVPLRSKRPENEQTNPGDERSTAWPSVALLAASLMLGLYLGASGVPGQLLDPLLPAGNIEVAEEDIVSELVTLGATPIEQELL